MNDIGEDDRAVRRPIPAPSWCRRNRGMIRKMAPIGVAMLLASAAMPAQASDATQSTFGTLPDGRAVPAVMLRSEEHTSELQSLMRISYTVFCLKKKND